MYGRDTESKSKHFTPVIILDEVLTIYESFDGLCIFQDETTQTNRITLRYTSLQRLRKAIALGGLVG